MTFKPTTTACVTLMSAAILLTACNAQITPAVQGPRYYTAAHDTVSGKCQRERLVTTHRHDGKTTVEDVLPQHTTAVKCVTTAVTTTGESN